MNRIEEETEREVYRDTICGTCKYYIGGHTGCCTNPKSPEYSSAGVAFADGCDTWEVARC